MRRILSPRIAATSLVVTGIVVACGSTTADASPPQTDDRVVASETMVPPAAPTVVSGQVNELLSYSCASTAIWKESPTANGVVGVSCSGAQSGVWGDNQGGGYGVAGSTTSNAPAAGVWGSNASLGYGVRATSASGIGLHASTNATSPSYPAIRAEANTYGNARAISAESLFGTAIEAYAPYNWAVTATSVYGTAVDGYTGGSYPSGNFEQYGSGSAVKGYTSGTGRAGEFVSEYNASKSQPTLDVTNHGPGLTARFDTNGGSGDGVYISTASGKSALNVVGGSKNAVVATSTGARLLYAEEASEVWFADYGFGRLRNGRAVVEIEPTFAETVNLSEPYHVFIQSYGDADLYVARRSAKSFEIRLRSGLATAEFSYRLVGKRRGYEGARLRRAPWADGDPNLKIPIRQ